MVRRSTLPRCAIAIVGLALGSLALRALAGALTGPILDEGLEARILDFAQVPASAASRPLARINVMREAPDASGRLFVNDLRGPLHVLDGGTFGVYLDLAVLRPALKTSPGLASGFVSFAFHPDFASNGKLYTVHSETVGAIPATHAPALATTIVQHMVIMEWTATDPTANVFGGPSRELLRIASPHHFHNVGEIAFDPNRLPAHADYGLLYIGGGDYGSVQVGEPLQLQRLDTPLGALLRIDPLGGDGSPYSYGIPASNPFAGDGDPATLDEIYAYGFRNGHRIAWDAEGSHDALVSDVGQGNVEGVDVLTANANYGWPEREGTFALDVSTDPETVFALPQDDATFGFTYPVAQYDHEEGRAISGGFVYRAQPSSPLYGAFIFGDIVSGRVFYAYVSEMLAADDGDPETTAQVYELSLSYEGSPTTLLQIVRDALGNPGVSRVDLRFGSDLKGYLFVMTKQDGFIRRLVPPPGDVPALPLAGGAALFGSLLAWAGFRIRARSAARCAARLPDSGP